MRFANFLFEAKLVFGRVNAGSWRLVFEADAGCLLTVTRLIGDDQVGPRASLLAELQMRTRLLLKIGASTRHLLVLHLVVVWQAQLNFARFLRVAAIEHLPIAANGRYS